jgi:hypothetical protein
MTRARSASILLAAALATVGCSVNIDHEGQIEREEKRFPVAKTVELHLYTFDGAIEVRSWDKPEVLVQIDKRGQDQKAISQIEILAEQTGDRIQIEARHPGSTGSFVVFGAYRSPSARFIANVPRQTHLVVRTGDGSVTVERVDGRIELRTGDGAIRVVETSGDLMAETSDGSLNLDDVSGRIEARTGDGSVRISGTPTVLRTRTGDGSIVLRIRNGASMADDWMAATGDGSVTVELPSKFDAEIDADPGSDGRVRNDLTLTEVTGGTRDHRALGGRLGSGGHRFVLRTGDGTIRLTNY